MSELPCGSYKEIRIDNAGNWYIAEVLHNVEMYTNSKSLKKCVKVGTIFHGKVNAIEELINILKIVE